MVVECTDKTIFKTTKWINIDLFSGKIILGKEQVNVVFEYEQWSQLEKQLELLCSKESIEQIKKYLSDNVPQLKVIMRTNSNDKSTQLELF